jgi:hypothetical protein
MKGVHHDEYGVLPHHTQEAMLHQVHQAQDVGPCVRIQDYCRMKCMPLERNNEQCFRQETCMVNAHS